MKHNMPYRLPLLAIIFFTNLSEANAQDTIPLKERVKILEQYNHEVLDQKFNAKTEQLVNQVHGELENAKNDLKKKLDTLEIVGAIGGLFIAFGFGTVFISLKKHAEKILKKKLESHLTENVQYIIDVISSQKTERLIKESKKILVISGDDDESKSTIRLLSVNLKFSHVEAKVVKFYEVPPAADLYVFSNMNKKLNEELIIEFLEKSAEDDSCVFYGDRLNYDRQAEYSERLNFANSKYTLYHQIINTLSFKEVISKN